MNNKYRQKGLTIIELIIGVLITLLVVLAIATLFLQTNRSSKQNEIIATMQENGRYTLNLLTQELKPAGYMGRMLQFDGVDNTDGSLTSITSDCGDGSGTWGYNFSGAGGSMEYLSASSSATTTTDINSAHDCISTTEATADTDVFAIKRVIGIDNCLDDSAACDGSGTAVTRTDNKFYVRSNGDNGCLWHATSGSSTPSSGACPAASDSSGKDWEFVNRVYYIRNYSQTAGDGIPTLCRKAMGGASPAMTTECLAEGIEYFHIMFGLDPDDDGIANQYEGAPTTTELAKAVSARIYILVRSKDPDNQYTNTKTYNLGDEIRTVNDSFYRRVYTTTVPLRNLANLKLFENT